MRVFANPALPEGSSWGYNRQSLQAGLVWKDGSRFSRRKPYLPRK